ncbi:acyltransferase domain-containing protein, partial [Nonomuraea sp. NPDC050643]|uniref:acyltransferase domain-containing protein n=1 Tax=Nonomuraea sp. NPDC050643 TaxID=3155660 RepID=UPI00340D724C
MQSDPTGSPSSNATPDSTTDTSSTDSISPTAPPLGSVGSGGTVFVFPGQGGQWPGMGRRLYAASPVFREHLDACAEALAPYTDWSLLDVLHQRDHAPSLDRVDVVQPALFAIMVALARLWQHHGIHPDAVIGHSQGEIAAAHIAGALTLQDAARITALRSKALTQLAGQGAMAAITLPATDLQNLLNEYEPAAEQPAEQAMADRETDQASTEPKPSGQQQRSTEQGQEPVEQEPIDQSLVSPEPSNQVSIAAINGPTSTIVSGTPAAIDNLLAHLETRQIRARKINVDYASHCAHVETLAHHLQHALAPITPQPATIPFYSTLTGDHLDTTTLNATYWYNNLRHPVLFHTTIQALVRDGHHAFIETSPHPVLTPALEDTLTQHPHTHTLTTLRRDHDTTHTITTALAAAHLHGHTLNWPTLFAHHHPQPTTLPTYPFQRTHYWLTATVNAGNPTHLGQHPTNHPLLSAAIDLPTLSTNTDGSPSSDDIESANGPVVFTGRFSLTTHPWIAEHRIHDTVLLPGTAFVDLALHAAHHTGHNHIDELTLHTPLTLTHTDTIHLHLHLTSPTTDGTRTLTIHSRPTPTHDEQHRPWTHHATATLTTQHTTPPPTQPWPPTDTQPLDTSHLYDHLADTGLHYGPHFQGLHTAWRQHDTTYAEITLPQDTEPTTHHIHPALLDAALHTTALTTTHTTPHLPFTWTNIHIHTTHPQHPTTLHTTT